MTVFLADQWLIYLDSLPQATTNTSKKYEVSFKCPLCEYRNCCILIILQISGHDSDLWHIIRKNVLVVQIWKLSVLLEKLFSLNDKFEIYVLLQVKGTSHFKLGAYRLKTWVTLRRCLSPFFGYGQRLSIGFVRWKQSLVIILNLEAYEWVIFSESKMKLSDCAIWWQ